MPIHTTNRIFGRRFMLNDTAGSSSFAAMPIPQPLQPSTSSIAFWFRSDSITGKSGGDPINNWIDVDSGVNITASNNILGNAPKYAATTAIGKPAVIFTSSVNNGPAAWLSLPPSTLVTGYSATVGVEIFMVAAIMNPSNNGYWHNFGGTNTVNNNLNVPDATGIRTTFGVNAGITFSGFANTSASIVGIYNEYAKTGRYQFLYNSHSYQLLTNVTGAMTTFGSITPPSASLFAGERDAAPVNYWAVSGSVFEVLGYSAVLTPAERDKTYAYLAAKYNITLG